MKKISTFFLFVSIGVYSIGQEDIQKRVTSQVQPATVSPQSHTITKSVTGTSTTISIRPGESQITHDNAYYQNEIVKIDAQISSINTKIFLVNSDPQEKVLATDSGWFSDMENIKSELENKRAEIQDYIK